MSPFDIVACIPVLNSELIHLGYLSFKFQLGPWELKDILPRLIGGGQMGLLWVQWSLETPILTTPLRLDDTHLRGSLRHLPGLSSRLQGRVHCVSIYQILLLSA